MGGGSSTHPTSDLMFAQKHNRENVSKSGYTAERCISMTLVLLKRIRKRLYDQGFGVSPSDWAG